MEKIRSQLRRALIGSTGFVGGALARQRRFQRAYNSVTIEQIAGERFDLVVCAGAPAAMWAANAQPEADVANLSRLYRALRSADIGRVVLISTIAVFDDASKGYTESSARFEDGKAYGRNRRELEKQVMGSFDCHVLRLPALFGQGLKKNFIFDLMNPIPSFVPSVRFEELTGQFGPDDRELLRRAFAFDSKLAVWRFDRRSFPRGSGEADVLERAFRGAGLLSASFTNSESRFQLYNIERLAEDIDRCIDAGIRVLNVCSTPLRAADIHRELLGAPFENTGPPLVVEDVRTEFAARLGGSGCYLYSREAVLGELRAYVAGPVAA